MATNKKSPALNAKAVHAIGALLTVGMISGTGFYLYTLMEKSSAEMLGAREKLRTSKDELEFQLAVGAQIQQELEQLQARVDSQPSLGRASGYNMCSSEIASSAESAGIRVDTLNPEEQIIDGQVSWIPITCVGEGSISELVGWIEDLEASRPDIVVQSLGINTDAQSGKLRFRTLFRWYVLAGQPG